MSKFFVFAILVSALAFSGFSATLAASTQPADSDILVKCSTCGVEFTAPAATEQHMKAHPGHKLTMPNENLIKCSTCGAEFTAHVGQKHHPTMHSDHMDKMLIKCSTCGVQFTAPDK